MRSIKVWTHYLLITTYSNGLQVINNATSVVTAIMAMVFLDLFGRRSLVFHGGWSQGAFLIAIGALGRKTSPNVHERNGIVASMQMYTCILHMTLGPGAYITAAEVGTQKLREKTMALSVGTRCYFRFPVLVADALDRLLLTWLWVSSWYLLPRTCSRTLVQDWDTFGVVLHFSLRYGHGSLCRSSR